MKKKSPKRRAEPTPTSAAPQSSEIVAGLFLLMLTAVLISAPFILSFLTIGEKTLFGCFATDTMYYLAIAKNTVLSGFFTFNRETVTNGFQPLWQYILVLFQWMARPSLENQLLLTFVLNLLLVILGFAAALWGVLRSFGIRVACLMSLLMIPGAFTLLFEPSLGHTSQDPALLYSFSSWAFVNGMESGVSIAAFGLFLMSVLVRLSRANTHATNPEAFSLWSGVWLSAIVLARLDDVFLVPCIVLAIFLFDRGDASRRIRQLVRIVLPVTVFVLLYLAYNLVTAGVALPLSALRKAGFVLAGNLNNGLSLLSNYQPAAASRMVPMLAFILFGATVCVYVSIEMWRVRSNEGARENRFKTYLVMPLSGYVFLKGSFHLSMIDIWNQGWWYYSGQIFIFNFLLSVVGGSVLASRDTLYKLSFLIACVVTMAQAIDTGHRIGKLRGYAETSFTLWDDRESLNASLKAIDRDMKLIDNMDGLYGFILDMPVSSGTGLVFSMQERRDADRKGKVAALIDRGFTVLPVLQDEASWRGHYLELRRLDVQADLLYVDKRSGVSFYRLSRKARRPHAMGAGSRAGV